METREANILEWAQFWAQASSDKVAAPIIESCQAALALSDVIMSLGIPFIDAPDDVEIPLLPDLLVHQCDAILLHLSVNHATNYVETDYPEINASREGARQRTINSWT